MVKLRVEPVEPIVAAHSNYNSSETYSKRKGMIINTDFEIAVQDMVIEGLRKDLHKCIDTYGLNNIRTVKKSQELDKALNKKSCLSSQK